MSVMVSKMFKTTPNEKPFHPREKSKLLLLLLYHFFLCFHQVASAGVVGEEWREGLGVGGERWRERGEQIQLNNFGSATKKHYTPHSLVGYT